VPARTSSPAALAARLLRVRWIVRAPVWLYRARLGFVFGSRLLMLEHTGRKTGIRRYVVLEAVDHPDPGTGPELAEHGTVRHRLHRERISAVRHLRGRPGGARLLLPPPRRNLVWA
jgi:hypothetical protein